MIDPLPSTEQIVTHDGRQSYIYLAGPIERGGAVRQMHAGPDIILDFDKDGHVIGIELLEANLLHPALKARAVRPGSGGRQAPADDDAALEKRTWIYVNRPADYLIAGCSCGNEDPDWSEYKGRLWCDACKMDFVPAHDGVFDGPIPIHTARLLGLNFDRFNLETGRVEPFCPDADKEPDDGPGPDGSAPL